MPLGPRTPSHLKWMSGRRARIAGELEILEEWLPALKRDYAKACAQAQRLAEQLDGVTAQQVRLTCSLRALDATMKLEPKSLDASHIAAIRAQCGRYGKRGSLKNTIEQVLREAAPDALSTAEISTRVATKLGVAHRNRSDAKRWQDNSLWNGLRMLVNEETVRKVGRGRTRKGQTAALWAINGKQRDSLADLAKKQDGALSKRA